jgi:hypothetical protein
MDLGLPLIPLIPLTYPTLKRLEAVIAVASLKLLVYLVQGVVRVAGEILILGLCIYCSVQAYSRHTLHDLGARYG